jgi:hypothetical protein
MWFKKYVGRFIIYVCTFEFLDHGLFIRLATEVIVAGVGGIQHLTPKRRQG